MSGLMKQDVQEIDLKWGLAATFIILAFCEKRFQVWKHNVSTSFAARN